MDYKVFVAVAAEQNHRIGSELVVEDLNFESRYIGTEMKSVEALENLQIAENYQIDYIGY